MGIDNFDQEIQRVKILKAFLIFHILVAASGQAWGAEKLALQQVTTNVYALVGELGNRTQTNLGNNATFGFVVTSEGVVLVDSGGTYKGAQEIKRLIESVTDQPVVTVINTGGQDHRWLGNGYFKTQGAQIIASEDAVSDQKARTRDQFFMLGNLVGDEGLKGTDPVYADKTFKERLEFTRGSTVFKIFHAGHAHTPGDSFIWLPQENVMFTGDIVYVERMLGVGAQSNSKSWVSVYEKMADFQPQHLIPGHGQATGLTQANTDTYEYLVFLRNAVSDFIENGGDIADISSVDQSKYSYLENFEALSGRNAQQIYIELEWE